MTLHIGMWDRRQYFTSKMTLQLKWYSILTLKYSAQDVLWPMRFLLKCRVWGIIQTVHSDPLCKLADTFTFTVHKRNGRGEKKWRKGERMRWSNFSAFIWFLGQKYKHINPKYEANYHGDIASSVSRSCISQCCYCEPKLY